MNSSTACNHSSSNKDRRQSSFTLAFFCFAIITALMFSCSENIFSTPYGNKTLTVDTLAYSSSIITNLKNLNVPASGNALVQNKVGNYSDLSAKFLIKFTNFVSLNNLKRITNDSAYAVINQADVILHVADYWGRENSIYLRLSMLDNDSTIYWENSSDPMRTFEEIQGWTTPYKYIYAPTDADSIIIPLDTSLVNDWYKSPDLLYANNGFTVEKSSSREGMISFHSIESSKKDSLDLRPRMRLQCSLYDTIGQFIQDSTFYVIGGGDLQYTESTSDINDTLFYLSQGNIHRSFVELDDLRQDSLLGPTDLLNEAKLSLVIDEFSSVMDNDDTLRMAARLFKTDYWEGDSIQYLYTAISPKFDESTDTVTLDVSQLIQYLVSTPKEMQYEGLFFYLSDEYNNFNTIKLDPAKTELDIIYTKVKDE